MAKVKPQVADEIDTFLSDDGPTTTSDWGSGETINLDDIRDEVYEPIPQGTYQASVDRVEHSISKSSDNPMLTWTLQVVYPVRDEDGEVSYRTRRLRTYTLLTQEHLPRLKRMIETLAPDLEVRSFRLDQFNELFVGKRCQVIIEQESYQGKRRDKIARVLPWVDSGDDLF